MSSLSSGAGDALPDGDWLAEGLTDGSTSDGCPVTNDAVGLVDDGGLALGGGADVQAATIAANRIIRVPQLTVPSLACGDEVVADGRQRQAG